jgi:glycosyltransferase involved in cell wall biosynthesis
MNRGGAETMIMNLYRHIDRSKVQFDFVVHTEDKCAFDDEITQLGGRIYRIPRYNGKNHFIYTKAWRVFLIKHSEFKIIHGHLRTTASLYLNIAKKFGLITIAHSHSTASRGNRINRLVKAIMQIPIKYTADYMFACSYEAGRWLFGDRVINNHKFRIFKNAIELNKFQYNLKTRNYIRNILNINDKLVVGHVGSFSTPKNHSFLLDIFFELQKYNEDSILLLIGDGELRANIEIKARKLDIKDKVIFIGSVPDVNDYIQAMDVFVFPSIFEGLGISLIEAQAANLPCVISDCIPSEVIVTNLIETVSLDAPPNLWVEKINKTINSNVRDHKNYAQLAEKGYCVLDTAKELEKFYLIISKLK